MTAKLLAQAITLASLIPVQATAGPVTIHVRAAAVIVLLAVAVAAVRPALATVARYPSSPYPRRGTNWRCA